MFLLVPTHSVSPEQRVIQQFVCMYVGIKRASAENALCQRALIGDFPHMYLNLLFWFCGFGESF